MRHHLGSTRFTRGGRVRWALLVGTAALLIAAALAGCGKDDPVKPPPPTPFQYPALDTPQNVMLNLKYSVERRDSIRTREIYDDGYLGRSTDLSGTITFSKDQEVAAIGGMAREPGVSSVTFTLPDPSTWVRQTYISDPPGWTTIQLQSYNIQVDDAVRGTMIAHPTPGSFFEFKFAPTLDAASATDTTWKVIRWTEAKN